MLDKLEIYITIVAALVVAAVSIYLKSTLFEMSIRMITIIIAFYIIGLIVKAYLRRKVFPTAEKPNGASGVEQSSITPPGLLDESTDDEGSNS